LGNGAVIDPNGIIDLHVFGVPPHDLGSSAALERNADKLKVPIGVAPLQLDEARNLVPAGAAPRSPKVEDHDIAAMVAQPEGIPLGRL
jgi:hypothetical protein